MKLSSLFEQKETAEDVRAQVKQAEERVKKAAEEDRGPGQGRGSRQRLEQAKDELKALKAKLRTMEDPDAPAKDKASGQVRTLKSRIVEIKNKIAREQQSAKNAPDELRRAEANQRAKKLQDALGKYQRAVKNLEAGKDIGVDLPRVDL